MARTPMVGLVLLASAALWAGCTNSGGGEGAPPVPTAPGGTVEPVLAQGRAIWLDRCSRCHGTSGGGGAGPRLDDGRPLRDFPDAAAQEDLVRNGRKGMPAFKGKLTDEEVAAVVRYTREVLNTP